MKNILHNQPTIGDEEVKNVEKVLRSQWLIAGDEVAKFEDTIKESVNKKYAVAVNSGHSALHLGLLAMGAKENTEVIVPDYAPADIVNAVYYTGATPVLVDIEKDGFNIDPKKIAEKITDKTKVIIVAHIFGFPADIDAIKEYNIPILEDCAQAVGSFYKNKPVGSFGEVSMFSFYATKVITTGQGGMVVTDNKDYVENIKDIINYNGRKNKRIRFNYPMTDIAAAIGNVQIKRLFEFIKKRKEIADYYRAVLKDTSFEYWPKQTDAHVNHFRFIIRFPDAQKRNEVMRVFAEENIMTIVPYSEKEILHNVFNYNKTDYPNAEMMASRTLSLPMYPNLREDDIERIVAVLEKIL